MRISRSADAAQTPKAEFENPFGPLHLAAEDEMQLEAVAQLFVRNTVAQYERFLVQNHRTMDGDRWKCLKRERDLRVFLQRREKDIERRQRRHRRMAHFGHRHTDDGANFSDTDGSSPSMSSRGSSISSIGTRSLFSRRRGTDSVNSSSNTNTNSSENSWSSAASARVPSHTSATPSTIPGVELPVLQVVGTVTGTLDDALYGCMGTTSESMRLKNSYERDNITDGAVLATITAPSVSDPFRSLTIKWVEHGSSVSDLALPRTGGREDLVFLEATGTTTLETTGQCIGFQLRHSVHFPQTHVRSGVHRGNMSVCTLFRESTGTSGEVAAVAMARGSVEVFGRACLSGGNSTVRAMAQSMANLGRVVLCARMRKLSWLLMQRHQPRMTAQEHMQQLLGLAAEQSDLMGLTRSLPTRKTKEEEPTTTVSFPASAAATVTSVGCNRCVTCKKRATWFNGGDKKKPRATCQLCLRYVCSSCRMKKTVASCVPVAPERDDPHVPTRIVQQDVTLCNMCVHHALVATSSRDVAREELASTPRRWRVTARTSPPSNSHAHSQPQLVSTAMSTARMPPVYRPASTISLRSDVRVSELLDRRARHY